MQVGIPTCSCRRHHCSSAGQAVAQRVRQYIFSPSVQHVWLVCTHIPRGAHCASIARATAEHSSMSGPAPWGSWPACMHDRVCSAEVVCHTRKDPNEQPSMLHERTTAPPNYSYLMPQYTYTRRTMTVYSYRLSCRTAHPLTHLPWNQGSGRAAHTASRRATAGAGSWEALAAAVLRYAIKCPPTTLPA